MKFAYLRAFLLSCSVIIFLALILSSCATAPEPAEPQPSATPEVPIPAPEEEPEFLRVFASKLNVRSGPGTEHEKVAVVERWERLEILEEEGEWFRVLLPDHNKGWVFSEHVVKDRPCPADRAEPLLIEEPPVSFVEGEPLGIIRVKVYVDIEGMPEKVELLENTTGDKALAEIARQEARQMKFDPPILDCEPQPFTYIYSREF